MAQIRRQVGGGHVICGLSGGVDSAVTAALVARAVGNRLTAILIDTGLLRANEATEVKATFQDGFDLRLVIVDAADEFLGALRGVTDPEAKRQIIGERFVRVFEREASRIANADFLAQGTIYPDVIESGGVHGSAAVIKSHHNVGGSARRPGVRTRRAPTRPVQGRSASAGRPSRTPRRAGLAAAVSRARTGGSNRRRSHG